MEGTRPPSRISESGAWIQCSWDHCFLRIDVLLLLVTAEIAGGKGGCSEGPCGAGPSLLRVSETELRSILGLLNNLVSLLVSLRPFCYPCGQHYLSLPWRHRTLLRSARRATYGEADPAHTVVVKAFLDLEPMRHRRTSTFATSLYRGQHIRVVTDASLWGLGGLLVVFDVFVSWFPCPSPISTPFTSNVRSMTRKALAT